MGDELLLKEWNPAVFERLMSLEPDPEHVTDEVREQFVQSAYTGQELLVRVDYIMPAEKVRQIIHPLLEPYEWDGHVIMSVSLLP